MWFEKLFKWRKKDKSNEDDLFKFLFPKMHRVHSNVAHSMGPPRPIPIPRPLNLYGKVEMRPPNIDKIVKDILDNIEVVDSILNDIPVIFLKTKEIKIKAGKRKLKSKYKVEYD